MVANAGYARSLIDLSIYAFLRSAIHFILRSTPIDQKMGAQCAYLPLFKCAMRRSAIRLVYNDGDDLAQGHHSALDLVAQCACNARIYQITADKYSHFLSSSIAVIHRA
jgi:hypothetical protein